MLNLIHLQSQMREKLSFAKTTILNNNGVLSQNAKAVTPNGLNWLFLRLNVAQSGTGAGVNPSYIDLATSKRFPLMVWLILQNKPIGEYVKRLLLQPRVRPHRPNLGLLLKIAKGAFLC